MLITLELLEVKKRCQKFLSIAVGFTICSGHNYFDSGEYLCGHFGS